MFDFFVGTVMRVSVEIVMIFNNIKESEAGRTVHEIDDFLYVPNVHFCNIQVHSFPQSMTTLKV